MHASLQNSIHMLLPRCIYYNYLSHVLMPEIIQNWMNPWDCLLNSKASCQHECLRMEKNQFCRKSTNSH